jgi:hypothetical protein
MSLRQVTLCLAAGVLAPLALLTVLVNRMLVVRLGRAFGHAYGVIAREVARWL